MGADFEKSKQVRFFAKTEKVRKWRFLAPLSAPHIAATELLLVSFCELERGTQNGIKCSSVAVICGAERGAENRDFSICIPTPALGNCDFQPPLSAPTKTATKLILVSFFK